MFELYTENRREGIPNLITEDFLLLAYSMVLQNEVERIEEALQQDVQHLVDGLYRTLEKHDSKAPGSQQALAFVATVRALGEAERGAVPDAVAEELKRIESASGVAASAVTGLKVDFSQMAPRGRYTRNEAAARYFRVVRYAGSTLFPLRSSAATQTSAEQADQLTAAAVTMSHAVAADPKLLAAFKRIDARTRWLFGRPDDLTVTDYARAMRANARLSPSRARAHLTKTFASRRPLLVGGAVDTGALEAGADARDVLLGWRLLPQRVTPDRVALQKLVFGGAGRDLTYQGSRQPRSLTMVPGVGPVRGFPLADDLLALLGSVAARTRLEATGDHEYGGFEKAFAEARQTLAPEESLQSDHLEIVRALASRTSADADVRLNTAAALWTLDKHREVLYAKQSYTGVGKGVAIDQRQQAWIDPAVETYVALRRQIDRITTRLVKPSDELGQLGGVLDRCIEIARQQRQGRQPNGADAEFLNNLDTTLRDLIGRDDGPLATDIHTDLNSGMTLVEALAAPTVVETAVGTDAVARGALFTHLEFRHPVADRLTDESWAQKVAEGVPEAAAVSARVSESFARRVAAYGETK